MLDFPARHGSACVVRACKRLTHMTYVIPPHLVILLV